MLLLYARESTDKFAQLLYSLYLKGKKKEKSNLPNYFNTILDKKI